MHKFKFTLSIRASLLTLLLILSSTGLFSFVSTSTPVHASSIHTYDDDFSFIILSKYQEHLKIGDAFYLFAITSNGKYPKFKSSDSKIASVNTYGLVTAKKPGKVSITAKIKDAEATCTITIEPTEITLNKKSASLESGSTFQMKVNTSNNSIVTYKSNKSSVASVDENGLITAKKPGEAIITVKANTTTSTCKITVRKPTLKLDHSNATLYRNDTLKLSCTVSSGKAPKWTSNRKSIATVDENGYVTALKHGTAIISATVDGVKKSCEISVKQPKVQLSETELDLFVGDTVTLNATVSSKNTPTWSTSNNSILFVDQGTITALAPGTAYVYAKEDGVKARCKIKVSKSTNTLTNTD